MHQTHSDRSVRVGSEGAEKEKPSVKSFSNWLVRLYLIPA